MVAAAAAAPRLVALAGARLLADPLEAERLLEEDRARLAEDGKRKDIEVNPALLKVH